jgi:molybdopterin/thiamine biosynthesis adenylyltransferase
MTGNQGNIFFTALPLPKRLMDNRYHRHTLISGWDQDRLHTATVVIMGVGALGNEAARILAMSGIGNLILCDFDQVSVSNLSRSGLFGNSPNIA